jgi:hypothetical protein
VFKAIRVVLFYGLLIMIILNVLSAFGGGMYLHAAPSKDVRHLSLDGVRGGFANAFSTASKYEINPEEIKVNFSDVRGVSALNALRSEDYLFDCLARLKKQKRN